MAHAATPAARPDVKVVSRYTAAKTSSIARTDRSLLGRRDSGRVDVLVKLANAPVATYTGGVRGFAPTSPSVTGRPLADSPAERAYDRFLQQQQTAFEQAAAKLPGFRAGRALRTVYGGVAASVPANRIADLLKLPGVVAVQKDEVRQPLTDASNQFIGADQVQQRLGGAKNAGRGIIFGVLDTGAWPEHPSFADQGNLSAPPKKADGGARKCDFGVNPLTKKKFACNNKIIGGQAFLDAYLKAHPDETYKSARDSDGHGTHTASTAAGDVLASAKVFGIERGPLHGIAPGAWVSVYKVCGAEGCYSSDSAAAVAQAIKDGVKVINFSISGGTDPATDPVELAFLDAYAAGVFVAASAGNEGPQEATVNHLSPWVTTVAASTQRREFTSTISLASTDGAKLTLTGSSLTQGVTTAAPVVLAAGVPGYGAKLCDKAPAKNAFAGKIIVCERGVNARVEKGYNVKQGGGVGMILYNPALQDTETDNHWLPAVHLAEGAQLLAYLGKHQNVSATFTAGVRHDGRGDVMAAFSSRGPGGLALKPDVTAPGVQILAGDTPTPDDPAGGPSGQYFQAIAGTSMSGPHVAGSAILLRAAHPGWTPGQTKSALMTTAVTKVVKEDLKTPADPFDDGAGRIAVATAVEPGLTFDETAQRMARLALDPIGALQINMPSINAPVMPGRVVAVRTVKNVTGRTLTYRFATTAPAHSAISVDPPSITVGPGRTARFSVTISSWAKTQQLFGGVRLEPAGAGTPALHLPVAFVPQQGSVALTGACVDGGCSVTAANRSYTDARVDTTSVFPAGVGIASVTGATRTGAASVSRNGVTLPGIVPGTPSLKDTTGSVYEPLSATVGADGKKIAAEAIGDEEIINFDTPAFRYAGQAYSRVGVSSDGYLVVGGGDGQDVNPEPNGLPDPKRPNNVLAPFWTDLDGTGADGVRVGVLDRAGRRWIVAEWRVNVFGTTSGRHFQVWIPTGSSTPTANIRFAYDPTAMPAAPGGGVKFLVGAENISGAAGAARTGVPKGDLLVPATSGKPGGTLTYSVRLTSPDASPGEMVTTMGATTVPGKTVIHTRIAGVKHP
ncbi:S8 family serine peptidase [Hamadaea tsunoensis]|uniref:S8 family serine peptidase n=1 Tax=Hamadaea tsunoensis TaxID=53368 RepID=UPI0003F9F939|nr:S8 family serine peptidase [Hamadaea tsunoensis]